MSRRFRLRFAIAILTWYELFLIFRLVRVYEGEWVRGVSGIFGVGGLDGEWCLGGEGE